jgi:RHS repeat-associated protein
MKSAPSFLRYLCLGTLCAVLSAREVAAQDCASPEPTLLHGLVVNSRGGIATLVGFDEFAPQPARKFRHRATSGTISLGRWNTAGCPNETANFTGSSTGPLGTVFEWTMSFDPATKQATGTFTRSGGFDPSWFGGQYVWQVEAGFWIGSHAIGEANVGSGTPSASVQRTLTLGHDLTVNLNWNGRHAGNGSAGTFTPNAASWTIGGASELWRDDWASTSTYDRVTGVLTTSQSPVRYREGAGGYFPLSSGGTVVTWVGFSHEPDNALAYGSLVPRQTDASNTRRKWQGTGSPSGNPPGPYFKASGTVETQLSQEDTDEDAVERLRANLQWGVGGAAHRQKRTSGFSFSMRDLEFSVPVDIECPGRYRVQFVVEERPLGNATAPAIQHLLFLEREFSSGRTVIKGAADAKELRLGVEGGNSMPMRADREYSVVKAEIAPASCDSSEPGGVDVALRSVHVALSLGAAAGGGSAGELVLDADTIDAALYSPAALQLARSTTINVTEVRDAANALRQVRSPALLADVVTLTSSSYEVRFYSADAIGNPDSAGLHAPAGAAFAVVKFENPEPANPTSGRFRLTESRGSRVRVSTYSRTIGANNAVTWTLERGDAAAVLATEIRVVTPVSATVRTERVTLQRGAVIDSVSEREITTFPWGEETTRETQDPAGANLTTTFEFHSNAFLAGYRKLATRQATDGSWERRFYDGSGRITRVVRPYLNSPIAWSEWADTIRATETAYATLPDADGDLAPEQLTTVVEKTLAQETARSYVIVWSRPVSLGGESFTRRADIQCTVAGAAWNASTNLSTETLTYAAGPFTGRARRVVRPDGTATLTTCALATDGTLTTVANIGQLNAAHDAIVDGTRVTTVTNPQGHVISEASRDIASGLGLASWDGTAFDSLGRPTSMLHHDGLVTTRDYACCGLLSERGRDGVLVAYDYDALGRRTHETRGGVTVRTDYDAAGRVLAIVRLGGAGDGDDITLQSSRYDLAGRLQEQRDARGRPTTFAETTAADGVTTRTTTHPDLGTTIETRARDGSPLTVSGSAASPRTYAYALVGGLPAITETRVGQGGATTEWSKTTRDFAGRTSLIVTPLDASAAPALATASQHYNAKGQLERSVDADGVTTLYAYNARGELNVTALDLDRDGVIDYDGNDRITRTNREVTTRTSGSDTFTVVRTTSDVWGIAGSNTAVTVAIAEEAPGGLRSWQTVPGPQGIIAPHGLTTSTFVAINAAAETRTVVTTAPDQTVVTQVYVSDRLASETVTRDSLGVLSATSHQYDAHGRLWKSTDARSGTTTYAWFGDDQLESVLTPDPDPDRTGPGYDPQLTRFDYDAAGRRSIVTHPDNAVTTTTYYATGQVRKVSGGRAYPVEYTYDPQGRVKTLTTWQDHAANAGAAVTTWNYHPARGLLAEKKYPSPAVGQPQSTLSYTYTDAGRLKTRTGGRGLVTTYGYTNGGDLETIGYSDATPPVAFGYDRRGRLRTVADAAGARTLDYDASGSLADEAYAAGLGALAGLAVDRGFDSLGRLERVSALSASSVVSQVDHGFDAASRLRTVALGASKATYTYVPNSALLDQTMIDTAGVTRLTTTRIHDQLGRLQSIAQVPHLGAPVSVGYTYNAANQRIRAQRENATAWSYGYDALGQLETARQAPTSSGTTFVGRDFGYTYDDIGNRRTATRTTSSGARTSTYTSDLLNRYTQRTLPGVAEVLGGAVRDSTVTLSSSATGSAIHLTERDGESFRGEVPVDNTAAPQYPEITVTAVKNNTDPLGPDAVATLTRRALVPKSPEVFTHDADGNLTADGEWSYSWDAENRLVAVETLPALVAPSGPLPLDRKRRVEYVYDAQHRRVARKAYAWNPGTSAWIATSDVRYLYDGWNVIVEFSFNSSTSVLGLSASYAWGLDLSGTREGAGGVGGLLFARLQSDPASMTHVAAADGNGNVLAYYDAATGERTARFEYGPFGEPLVDDGPAADQLTYRFSTKPRDPLAGAYYYGQRYYNPWPGRWLSKDPAEEDGGMNLYGFVANDPIESVDVLGLAGFFFDGTGNNAKSGTNVRILWQADNDVNKRYYRGVGSSFGTRIVGGLTGAGGHNRLEEAYRDFIRFVDAGDRYVDIVGFSRGAALAREFANLLSERGYDPAYGGSLSHKLRASTNKQPSECEFVIRFVGLFDSVGSFGVPGNNVNIGIRMDLPGAVGNAAQATAQNERRFLFPLTRLGQRDGFDEQGFPGDHSDIGRGHGDDTNDLSRAPLEYIWNQGRAAGVPFGPLPDYTPTGNTTPHDLSRKFPYNLFPKRPR